jgi:hypothetical protein
MAWLTAAPAADASVTQEMVLQDDPQVLGIRPYQLEQRIYFLKAIGVDRLRVSVFWKNVAPGRMSQRRPRFPSPGARFPQTYPAGAWDAYDNLVTIAKKHGLKLLFTLTGPAPAWATPGRQRREGLFKPSASDFKNFATAVGLRYSGNFLIRDRATGEIKALPRVDSWSIWNEPNFPSWLLPIWVNNRPKRASDMVAAAPHHYRKLVDAGWAGLRASGHGGDLILIGETAPRGGKKPTQLGNSMPPAEFVRELYCVKGNFRPYTGSDARKRGCPATSAARRAFRRRHPGLFRSTGYAHHAYSLDKRTWRAPTWRHPLKDNVPIGNLGRLTRTLDRAERTWGNRRRQNIWITEYGYQTTPPDPIAGVAPDRQGPLTAWGEYMAYRNPRVASIAQFLFVDDKPLPQYDEGDARRWMTWQSGLFAQDGAAKPFLRDYILPLHVSRSGLTAQVFGAFRPGGPNARFGARVEYTNGTGGWTPLRTLLVTNPRGYVSTTVTAPAPGLIRILWLDPVSRRSVPTTPARVG